MQHPPKRLHQKKNGKRLAILATLLLLMTAALLWLLPTVRTRHASTPAHTETAEAFRTLEAREANELLSVTVYPDGASSYTLEVRDGTLYLQKGGELLDVNDVYADELLEVFTRIVSQETVTQNVKEVEEHLSDMGLAPARAKAVIRYQDGTEALLEVGATVPNTTYAYFRWSGDPGVYMCDVGVKEAFALTENHLLPVVQPEIHASLVEEVRLTNAAGESTFRFASGASGQLVQPYAYPLSQAGTEQLLSALENFRLGTREAEVTEENRAQYGFQDPLCIVEIDQRAGYVNQIAEDGALASAQVDAQSLRFVIGRAEGDYFYTCEYEGDCYFISRFLTETLVKADRETLLTRTPADMGDVMIASIALEAPQGAWAVDVLRAEKVLPNNELEVDENGQVAYDTLVLINGEEKPEELFTALCDRLYALTVAGNVPENFVLSEGAEPRWSLTVETTSATKRQIDAYRMDAFSDALAVDGVMRHYVHSDAIDVLIAGLE